MIFERADDTITAQCYDKIEKKIVNGMWLPGTKLKIAMLKKEFSVGQSPIREALSRLSSSGLIEIENNKGFRVAPISQADIRDTYQVFFQIESLALTQAIQEGDDNWEASIAAALHHLALIEKKKAPTDYQLWAQRNLQFHRTLIGGCKSPLLLKLRDTAYQRFDRYCRISFSLIQDNLIENHDEHIALAHAILQRDSAGALKFLHHHIFEPLESVITALENNDLI